MRILNSFISRWYTNLIRSRITHTRCGSRSFHFKAVSESEDRHRNNKKNKRPLLNEFSVSKSMT